jgi:hypothetical protein
VSVDEGRFVLEHHGLERLDLELYVAERLLLVEEDFVQCG